jgi:hypothetical protein
MQDLETICPYPGLRPFTEEESLYFKGREDQITRLIHQLEEKKFLMVTGASGDGKSSLIYGGLIPQARAGFFKASYSKWSVAGFRPERSPMKNMAASIAAQLQIDPATAEIELSRGFSSLADLYKSSRFYIDRESPEWQKAGEAERDQLERKAGNLLIIIDQFEEFFTNPENFVQGIPSQDARLVLNIILETSKISLRDKLPIYVVCTMRSDYIGQCASFRGLPEYIGFSQFFVPRLQRKELQQAIEEPAKLSGNRISSRLTDRLIFDLGDGIDQLPILQHALKQIWKAADNGREMMDLIHYSMVGGMAGENLPKEDLRRFYDWKESLPAYQKKYLDNTGLSNVLDIHANKLYEEAADYFNHNNSLQLTGKEAKLIVALAFSCLTRLDENKPVRNRMTLEEVTRIINHPKFTMEVVSGVLSSFREPENTLVRPFIDDTQNPQSKTIDPETVLDITHEALIRNWQLLKKWSAREYEYHTVFLDLKQQSDRWTDSGRSGDYLLPIGPLTFFEEWYRDCRPNKWWINRYNGSESSPSEKIKESELILQNLQKFLGRSARQLLITRTFMKYGAAKILKTAGFAVLLGLAIFFLYNRHIQRNDVVIDKLILEGTALLRDRETVPEFKAYFLMFASRLDTSNITAISRQVSDNQTKIDIALKVFERLFFINKESDPPIKAQSLAFADSLINLSGQMSEYDDISELNRTLNNLNDLVRDEDYYLQTKTDNRMRDRFNNNKKLLAGILIRIFNAPSVNRNIDIKALNIAIENSLNFISLTPDQVIELTNSISPFGNNRSVIQKFENIFAPDSKLNVGLAQTISHNGGFEILACLYAAQGDVPNVLRCLDTLNKYNENYSQYWNNPTNIGGYFLMYNHVQSFRHFVKSYSEVTGIPSHIFVKTIASLAGIEELRRTIKFIQHGNYNENLALFDYEHVKGLFDLYKSTIEEDIKDRNELNFNLALFYKQQGAVYEKISHGRPFVLNNDIIDSLFSIATDYYSRLPREFLESKVEVYIEPAVASREKRIMKRSQIFIYPDHLKLRESFTADEGFRYYGDAFFQYMVRHNLFERYYHDKDDYELLINWMDSYFEMSGILSGTGYYNRTALNYPDLPQSTLLSVDSLISRSGYSNLLDDAWINLKLTNDNFESGDSQRAFERVQRLKFLGFHNPSYTEQNPFYNLSLNVAKQLAINGKRKEAMNFADQFSNIKNKISFYSKLASFTKMKGLDSESEIYQDSAMAGLKRVKFFRDNQGELRFDYRNGLVEMLTLEDNARANRQAREMISDMEREAKINGVLAGVRTLARMNHYSDATSFIPKLANSEDRLRCIIAILYVEVLKRADKTGNAWRKFDKDLLGWINYTEFLFDLYEY